jgi:drug/metabolite transporter (DMT)-like permease
MSILGGVFGLLAALTFALTNAAVRRGVRTGSAVQATTFSIPLGIPVFYAALLLTGHFGLFDLPRESVFVFAAAGINHFVIGRYCNYRSISAIGTNLAGTVTQANLVFSLILAILFLGEILTVLRAVGIVLVFVGPMIARRGAARSAPGASAAVFTPKLAEGYLFGGLSAVSYGFTPVLVRFAGRGHGLSGGLAGGVIGAAAATVVVIALLAAPGHWRELRAVKPEAAKWFVFSGVMVYVSQSFIYMALAIAPVTLVSPIVGLSNVFRIHFSRLLNPEHEVFGSEVVIATALCLVGAALLSMSPDILPLPASWLAVLAWHWP